MVKDLEKFHGKVRAVALFNPSDSVMSFSVPLPELELGGKVQARDVIRHQEKVSTEIIKTDPDALPNFARSLG